MKNIEHLLNLIAKYQIALKIAGRVYSFENWEIETRLQARLEYLSSFILTLI